MTSSTAFRCDADRRGVLAAVGRAVGHEGDAVMGVRVLDAVADLLVVLDEVEHMRRLDGQAEALDDWDVLRLLTSMPRWEPVPLQSLTAEERHIVRGAARKAVEVADGAVTRLAGPPVTRVLAVVTDTNWDRGLNVASRFAPVATRVLMLSSQPDDLDAVVTEAGEYGIGLALGTPDALSLVVQPQPWRENYVSPGGWLFREQVYRAYVDQVALTPAAGNYGPRLSHTF